MIAAPWGVPHCVCPPTETATYASYPGIADAARDQLLLHQFLSGLPQEVSKQLHAM